MYTYEKHLNRATGIVTDPKKLSNFFKLHKKEAASWAGLLFAVVFVYHCFSDGDFSFSLTLSSLMQMFGFLMVSMKVSLTKNVSGLSLQTLICYSVALFAKLCSIIFFEGYLPYDRSGDVIYRAVDVLSFLFCIRTIYLLKYKFKSSYDWEFDKINALALIVPTFLLAIFFHPALNNCFFPDVAWTSGLYLEAIAMIPQIYLFTKKGGEIESFTSHYVASQGFSRFLAVIFWIVSFQELNEVFGKDFGLLVNWAGEFVLGAQIIQLIIIGEFIFYYIKSARKGIPMMLPTYNV